MTAPTGKGSGQFPPRARSSGSLPAVAPTRVGRLLGVLAPYLARISAEAVVKGALSRHGWVESMLTADQLEILVADVMVGLRLFCDPARLPELMVDLALFCESEHA